MRNYGREPAFCALELVLDADFADLFEVKEGRVEHVGDRSVEIDGACLEWRIRRRSFSRGVRVEFSQEPHLSDGHAAFEAIVPPAVSGPSACSSHP